MCVCVNGTANLRCAVHEQFTYHSLRTEICRFFARTQRELDAPGVLSMHRVSSARLRFVEINKPGATYAPHANGMAGKQRA